MNIYPPSTKFIQCQTIARNVLKSSPNEDIQTLWKPTDTHTNLQCDKYKDTKQVLKAFRSNQDDRLTSCLVSQGSFYSGLITFLTKAQLYLVFCSVEFAKKYFQLHNQIYEYYSSKWKNFSKWLLSSSSNCSFCLMPESLLHVVAGCNVYLSEGRYTWRHDSILHFIASTFQSIQEASLIVDLPGFVSPSVITGDSLRPDLLINVHNKCLYVLKLTAGCETNLANNITRIDKKYQDLIMTLRHQFNKVTCINLSISTLGVFASLSTDFIKMLKELNITDQHQNHILRKLSTIAIRSTCHIFCRRDQEWTTPDVLTL